MTIDDICRRHSVRNYNGEPITKQQADAIRSELTYANTAEAGLHLQLCTNDAKPFESFRRSYGFFKNVTDYVACVIDAHFPFTAQKAGYYAELVALKCVEMGLGSCIVGGTFDRNAVGVNLRAGESISFLMVVGNEASEKRKGIMGALMGMHKPKRPQPVDMLLCDKGIDAAKLLHNNTDFANAMTALCAAPSALGKHPVRIHVSSNGTITATLASTGKFSQIDLGAAMCNFEAGYAASAEPDTTVGVWEWGEKPIFYPDRPLILS